MTKPVLLAALLGGLLGAVFAFVLTRAFPATPPPPSPVPASEAREVGDFLVGRLKAEKYDELAATPLVGVPQGAAERIAEVKKSVAESRKYCAALFGQASGEMELVREATLGPSLTRLVYLEKFSRGGVVWVLGMFRAADAWCLISLNVEPLEVAFPAIR